MKWHLRFLLVGVAGLMTGATVRSLLPQTVALGLSWIRCCVPDHPASVGGVGLCLGLWISCAVLKMRISGLDFHGAGSQCAQPFWVLGIHALMALEAKWFAGDIGMVITVGTGALVLIELARIMRPELREGYRRFTKLNSVRWKPISVAAVSFVLSLLYSSGLAGPRPVPSGDEPSYLMIARSLASDCDIVMDNNYQQKEYRYFGVDYYQAFTHLGKDGLNYPHHSIGLGLFLAPLAALAPKLGSSAIVFLLRMAAALIAAALFVEIYRLCLAVTEDERWSLIVCYLASATVPLWFYASELYPEMLAGLCGIVAFKAMALPGQRSRLNVLQAGTALGFLPWLGIKYLAIMAGIGVSGAVYAIRSPSGRRRIGYWFAPSAFSMAIFLVFLYQLYGNISPTSIYTGVSDGAKGGGLFLDSIVTAESLGRKLITLLNLGWGLLLEQRMGLVFLAPFYLCLIPGVIVHLKRNLNLTILLLIPGLAHLTVYGLENNWGGYCPPNRPIVTALPFVMPLVVVGLRSIGSSRAGRWLRTAMIVQSLVISACYLSYPPWLYQTLNPHLSGGGSKLLQAFQYPGLPDFAALFPLIMGDTKHHAANTVWSAATIALIASLVWLARRSIAREPTHVGNQPDILRRIKYYSLLTLWVIVVVRLILPPAARRTYEYETGFSRMQVNFLDANHYGKERNGVWIRGSRTAKMRLITDERPKVIRFRASSLIDNSVTIACGSRMDSLKIRPNQRVEVRCEPRDAVKRFGKWYTRCAVRPEQAVKPLQLTETLDQRELGIFLEFIALED